MEKIYIMKNSERIIVKIIKEICIENNISYKSYSYDWLFRLSKNEKVIHIFGYQFENNSATTQAICLDKSATSDLLISNNIPSVENHLFMSPMNIKYIGETGNWKKLIKLLNYYDKLVCKKNEGKGGSDVYLVMNEIDLEEAVYNIFKTSRTMVVSPFYNISEEYRIIILNNTVKLIYSKNIPFIEGNNIYSLKQLLISYMQKNNSKIDFNTIHNLDEILQSGERYYLNWQHNLSKGAIPKIIEDKNKKKY
jgi:D-alanine-D-alanine ligase-like ATP-grasp enzyme